jgi:hypothetical protein
MQEQPTTTGLAPSLGVNCQSFTGCRSSMLLRLRQRLQRYHTLIYATLYHRSGQDSILSFGNCGIPSRGPLARGRLGEYKAGGEDKASILRLVHCYKFVYNGSCNSPSASVSISKSVLNMTCLRQTHERAGSEEYDPSGTRGLRPL